MFAVRAAMQQNNPFQNPGSVVSAPPATTFRPPPNASLRHAEHFNQDAREAILSSHGGPQFGMNETVPITSSNGPEPDALSIGNVVPAGQNANPFARRMFSPMRPQPPVPPPPVPQAHNPWRPPPTSSQPKQAPSLLPSLLPTPTQSPSRVNEPEQEEISPNSLGLFGVGPPGPSPQRSNSKVGKDGSIAPSTPPSTPRVMAMRSVPT